MNDYYQQFLATMSGVLAPSSLDDPFAMASQEFSPPLSSTQSNYSATSQTSQSNASEPAKPQKSRRRVFVGAGGEPVKHRRTRSGCFTCRSRRVKCDEGRPTCKRCKKGGRDCVYPDGPGRKSSSGVDEQPLDLNDESKTQAKVDSACQANHSEPPQPTLPTIVDEEESGDDLDELRLPSDRKASETPSQDGTKSSSPSGSAVTTTSFVTTPYKVSDNNWLRPATSLDWSHLPAEMREHLTWFKANMTHYHWCMVSDTDDFFQTILPVLALANETLLNAFVGFIAYHVTLQNPDGKITDFLKYYNKSVSLLLTSLQQHETHDVATLLTILQLATIEEYLGDWVNLLGHQKAAFEMLTKIFTPTSVMQSPVGRMCLYWYARADSCVAIMGAFPVTLPREWFTTRLDYHRAQCAANPADLSAKIEERLSHWRLINYEMSILFARGTRGQIESDDFNREHEKITQRLYNWRDSWDPMLTDPRYLVTDFPASSAPNAQDIVNPYQVGILYKEPLLCSTILDGEWHAVMLMHESQSGVLSPGQLFSSMAKHAYMVCQCFETLEYWPQLPNGAISAVQAPMGMAAIFLPKDKRHQNWLRRKQALIESTGFLTSATFRNHMAEAYGDSSIKEWWLPNSESLTPVLRRVRDFADERNAVAITAQQEDLAEIKSIFSKLKLTDD